MLQFTRAIANFCEIGVQDDRNQKRHKNLPRQEKEPTQSTPTPTPTVSFSLPREKLSKTQPAIHILVTKLSLMMTKWSIPATRY